MADLEARILPLLRRGLTGGMVVTAVVTVAGLQYQGAWRASSGDSLPYHFTIALADARSGALEIVPVEALGPTLRRRVEAGAETSYLIPPELVVRHPTTDTDTRLEVRNVGPGRQEITIDYEIAITNHGWSRYVATEQGFEPGAAQEANGMGLVVAPFTAMAFALLWTVLTLLIRLGFAAHRLLSR